MLQWELFAKGDALEGRLRAQRRARQGHRVLRGRRRERAPCTTATKRSASCRCRSARKPTRRARSSTSLRRAAGSRRRSRASRSRRARTASRILVVSDTSSERVAVYDLEGKLLGRFQLGAGGAVDAVGENEGIALATVPMGDAYPGGRARHRRPGQRRRAQQLQAGRLARGTGRGRDSPRRRSPIRARRPTPPRAPSRPTLETPAVETWGDAADDPAIWVNPRDPAKSAVIATDKNLGLYVYDLEGKLLQTVTDGRMNNVDVRDGLMVDGKPRTLVAASNRTDKSIALYWLDPATRRLSRAGEPVPTGFGDPYGLCMYADASGIYVFVNNGGDGLYRQWRITAPGGKAVGEQVREFSGRLAGRGLRRGRRDRRALHRRGSRRLLPVLRASRTAARRASEIDRVDGPNGLEADIEGVSRSGRARTARVTSSCRTRVRTTTRCFVARATMPSSASSTSSPTRIAASTACRKPTGSTWSSAPLGREIPRRAPGRAGRTESLAARAPELTSSCPGATSPRRSGSSSGTGLVALEAALAARQLLRRRS